MLKFPKIIYFIRDGVPTDEEMKDAYRYGGGVVFRNASFVPAAGCLESCEGVAGSVPGRYAAKFPPAQEALSAYVKSLNIGEPEPVKYAGDPLVAKFNNQPVGEPEPVEPPAGKIGEKEPKPEPKTKVPEPKAEVKWKPNS